MGYRDLISEDLTVDMFKEQLLHLLLSFAVINPKNSLPLAHQLFTSSIRERGVKYNSYLIFPTERDLPVGLDQKIITWELVQKEHYLVNLEQEKKESNEERLKATSNK